MALSPAQWKRRQNITIACGVCACVVAYTGVFVWAFISRASPFAREIASLVAAEDWPAIIDRTTLALDAGDERREECLYFRGFGHVQMGDFRAALSDMASAGSYGPWPGWPNARAYREMLADATAPLPEHPEPIYGSDGRLLYYLHYDQLAPWTEAMGEHQRLSFEFLERLFGVRMGPVHVYLFNNWGPFERAFTALGGTQPRSWQAGTATSGCVLLCRTFSDGTPSTSQHPAEMAGLTCHEWTHLLLRQQVGPLDKWLDEGLAYWAGDQAVLRWAGRRPINWLGSRALDLGVLNDPFTYYDPAIATDAYAQASGMTEALIGRMGPQGVPQFVKLLKQHGDVDAALTFGWGIDSEDLLEEWKASRTSIQGGQGR
ncbi:MAG TPA: hypothetical protein QGH10_01400 [Armatimonadota bacterium]|nr:hypothetical protein [Armatimonadota bacterium]